MTRAFRVVAALALCFALSGAPLLACCTDFWSCASAVVSAGLTCEIEAALLVLRLLIDKALAIQADASRDFESSVKGMSDDNEGALNRTVDDASSNAARAQKALEEARKIVGDDFKRVATQSGVLSSPNAKIAPTSTPTSKAVMKAASLAVRTATPAPGTSKISGLSPVGVPSGPAASSSVSARGLQASAIPPDAHDAMIDMERLIETEQRKADAAKKRAVIIQQKSQGLMDAQAAGARASFKAAFLDKVNQFLADLQAAVASPVGAVKLAVSAASTLDDILKALGRDVSPIVDEALRQMQLLAAAPAPSANDARAAADKAAAILDKMRRAQALRTAIERKSLSMDYVGNSPTPSLGTIARTSPHVAAFRASVRKATASLGSLRADLLRVSQPAHVDVTTFRARLAGDFDAAFKGKSPGDAATKRDELLADAQSRYPGDPATLAAVQKLIADEARARGAK